MRSATRGTLLALAGTMAGAAPAWAHPGHVTHGGLWHTLTHALSSPYHVAVLVAVAVVAVAWAVAVRSPSRAQRTEMGADDSVS
ncbi:MAG: hypothetical protein AMXMBFR53_44560 [Gemmatimonadota bacterium]